MDIFDKNKRSEIMKSVKSKNNKSTELKLIEIFKKYKIKGWRRNYKIIGNPDFIFSIKKIAVFVDGCFWHGHNCRNLKPKDNYDYWDLKIKKNKERDILINKKLSNKNWIIIRIWECELKKKNIYQLLNKIRVLKS